jgi:ATP-dependent DNA helicase RecG
LGVFLVKLFKDNLNEEQLAELGLNERQVKAIGFVKEKGKISNSDFQELYGVSKATATRDLAELVEKYELFEKLTWTGAGTVYILKSKGSKCTQKGRRPFQGFTIKN